MSSAALIMSHHPRRSMQFISVKRVLAQLIPDVGHQGPDGPQRPRQADRRAGGHAGDGVRPDAREVEEYLMRRLKMTGGRPLKQGPARFSGCLIFIVRWHGRRGPRLRTAVAALRPGAKNPGLSPGAQVGRREPEWGSVKMYADATGGRSAKRKGAE